MDKNNRCLITGCEGFIGSHLADLLIAKGLLVYGMVYGDTDNIDHLDGKIMLHECDLKDKKRIEKVIKDVKPNYVFHLAAQSFVTVSWENPEETLMVNVLGTFYLLESIRKSRINPLIEIIGSSAIYGLSHENEMPLKETKEFRPTSMYAVSKASDDALGYFYSQAYGMKIIRVRPFNMTGPRKTNDACSDFTKGIIEVEKGYKDMLEAGNLETTRDFTDGRDAVKALWLLAEKGKIGEVYNLCSGRGYKMEEILKKAITLSGMDIKYKQIPEKMRPTDDPIYIGDNTKLRSLGWRPQIPIEKSLSDMLAYWREKLCGLPALGDYT